MEIELWAEELLIPHKKKVDCESQAKADLIPIDLNQLKLRRPNYPDNCLILDIADNVKDKVVSLDYRYLHTLTLIVV